MAGRPTDEVAKQREETAWTLRQKGYTEASIAEVLGISIRGVSKILHRIEDRTFRDLTQEIALIKARQTAQLEWAADEAARSWERSAKGPSANPAYLTLFRELLADIRKIWGLDAPQKVAATDDQGSSSPVLEALRLGMAAVFPTARPGPDAVPEGTE